MASLGRVGCDELLDALTFARTGKCESLAALASQIDDSPWFSIEIGRLLYSLAHIDLSLNSTTLRPEAWAIAPAALALLPTGDEAVLCGARSGRLIRCLTTAVE